MGLFRNKSRALEQKILESKEYMELTQNFQPAFNELQEADRHPKRLGSRDTSE